MLYLLVDLLERSESRWVRRVFLRRVLNRQLRWGRKRWRGERTGVRRVVVAVACSYGQHERGMSAERAYHDEGRGRRGRNEADDFSI